MMLMMVLYLMMMAMKLPVGSTLPLAELSLLRCSPPACWHEPQPSCGVPRVAQDLHLLLPARCDSRAVYIGWDAMDCRRPAARLVPLASHESLV